MIPEYKTVYHGSEQADFDAQTWTEFMCAAMYPGYRKENTIEKCAIFAAAYADLAMIEYRKRFDPKPGDGMHERLRNCG